MSSRLRDTRQQYTYSPFKPKAAILALRLQVGP